MKVRNHLQNTGVFARNVRIKVDLQGFEWEGMDWIDLAEDGKECRAVVNKVMNL